MNVDPSNMKPSFCAVDFVLGFNTKRIVSGIMPNFTVRGTSLAVAKCEYLSNYMLDAARSRNGLLASWSHSLTSAMRAYLVGKATRGIEHQHNRAQ